MNVEEIKQAVNNTTWWHTIDLGHGIVTPGSDDSPYKLEQLGMPERLTGRTVLDIGASDGFFSFQAERRGASRVLGVDVWSGHTWGMQAKTGFDIAREALVSKVESRQMTVLDITPEALGVFDLVLFLGVLYHMRHPLLALERVFSVTGKQLILETHMEWIEGGRPAMVFYPGAELNRDETNWWGPNAEAVEAMLKSVGFNRVMKYREYAPRPRLDWRHRLKRRVPFWARRERTRVVFHAWR